MYQRALYMQMRLTCSHCVPKIAKPEEEEEEQQRGRSRAATGSWWAMHILKYGAFTCATCL